VEEELPVAFTEGGEPGSPLKKSRPAGVGSPPRSGPRSFPY
jgi:hypothetical protein